MSWNALAALAGALGTVIAVLALIFTVRSTSREHERAVENLRASEEAGQRERRRHEQLTLMLELSTVIGRVLALDATETGVQSLHRARILLAALAEFELPHTRVFVDHDRDPALRVQVMRRENEEAQRTGQQFADSAALVRDEIAEAIRSQVLAG